MKMTSKPFQPLREIKLKQLKSIITKREQDVVQLVIQGYSNKQISRELRIKEKTVKSHLVQIFKKLGVRSRLQLTVALLSSGINKSFFRTKSNHRK